MPPATPEQKRNLRVLLATSWALLVMLILQIVLQAWGDEIASQVVALLFIVGAIGMLLWARRRGLKFGRRKGGARPT